MTRVLHVISGLSSGGAEGALAELVLTSREGAPEQLVVSLTPGGALRTRLEHAGVAVADLGLERGRPRAGAIWALRRHLRAFAPDAIQCWMYHADLIATLASATGGSARSTRLYWGVRCSDMDVRRYSPWLRVTRRACALLSRRPDAIVANSHAGRLLHQAIGYRAERFVVIPNGIDTQRFAPRPDARTCIRGQLGLVDGQLAAIVLARCDPMKGYPQLLEAAARLPAIRFVLAGAGTDELDLPGNVIGLGHRDDAPSLLNACDVIVSSSLFGEGFSNAIAEGMASGLCPVVTDVGDAGRIVGETGTVVAPGDVDALTDGLARLLNASVTEVHRRGRAARDRVARHFGKPAMVAAFDRLHHDDVAPGEGP